MWEFCQKCLCIDMVLHYHQPLLYIATVTCVLYSCSKYFLDKCCFCDAYANYISSLFLVLDVNVYMEV